MAIFLAGDTHGLIDLSLQIDIEIEGKSICLHML